MKTRITKHIDWTEMTRLVSEMKEDNNRLHLLITIQSMLGLRIGDVLSLRWRDLMSSDLLLVEKKTAKTRRMIVNPDLMGAVQNEFERSWAKKTGYIFMNKAGTGVISISYVNRALKKAFKKYGVEADQVSSHCFRKTFAYKILEDNNFSEKAIFTISSMFNHASVGTTMKYLLLDQREADNIYKGLRL